MERSLETQHRHYSSLRHQDRRFSTSLQLTLIRDAHNTMQPGSCDDLMTDMGLTSTFTTYNVLSSIHFGGTTKHTRNIFVLRNQDPDGEAVFVHGINSKFMTTMRNLKHNMPVVLLDDGNCILHGEGKPLTVFNTGTREMKLGDTVTVVPPLTNLNRSHGTLQTYEYTFYAQTFSDFCCMLRIALEAIDIIDNNIVTSNMGFLAYLYTYMDHWFQGNMLWEESMRATTQNGQASSNWEGLKKLLEVAASYWKQPLGLSTISDSPAQPFLASSELLTDIRTSIQTTDNSDVTTVRSMDVNKVPEKTGTVANKLDQVFTSLHKGQVAMRDLAAILPHFKPPMVGVVNSAHYSTILPNGTMTVILSTDTN